MRDGDENYFALEEVENGFEDAGYIIDYFAVC
jgi:hypothetical protein